MYKTSGIYARRRISSLEAVPTAKRFNNGTIGKTIQALIPDKIVGYVDIADENNHPKNLKDMKYDKIIISVLGREEEIIKYLVEDLQIPRDKIITLEL